MRKFTITHKNITYEVSVEESGGPEQLRVVIDGEEHLVEVMSEKTESRPKAPPPRSRVPVAPAHAGEVKAPLPGGILKVLVKEGDAVKADTVVCILEAMKMETQVQADQEGIVAEVLIKPGDKVEGGQLLVRIDQD